MKVVVAVSGGVDSVVLLDMLAKKGEHELVVAHFDHGMREDSASDARFVVALAERYGVPCEVRQESLGGASEERARLRRYAFLFSVAKRHGAKLATAHHVDDVVETVALNIVRGTRWRGLAGMSDERIWRPLTKRTKSELIEHALGEQLEWVEDETNRQAVYTRNRLRQKLARLPRDQQLQIYQLWISQQVQRREISREIEQGHFPIFRRYFMTMVDKTVARELLYDAVLNRCGVSLLGRQLDYLWLAIKTGKVHTRWHIGQGVTVELGRADWHVQMSQK